MIVIDGKQIAGTDVSGAWFPSLKGPLVGLSGTPLRLSGLHRRATRKRTGLIATLNATRPTIVNHSHSVIC